MHIGEKIKSIRTSKQLTQRQLAGDQITRNMLSRIENGTVTPSLQTVLYLAGRLNVSPGFLLSEGEDELLFRKFYKIENIKRAFENCDFRICRDLCLESDIDDDEINLILARCCSAIAKEEFNIGRLRSAGRYFDESIEYSAKSLYSDETFRAEAMVYFRYMKKISPTLAGDVSGKNVHEGLSFGDPFCLYAVLLDEMSNDIINEMTAYKNSVATLPQPYSLHLAAHGKMSRKEYGKASELLMNILNSSYPTPEPFLYNVFYDLEICSREVEDFKGAYEFSSAKVDLLERILSESDI